jgi:hypothetical protein
MDMMMQIESAIRGGDDEFVPFLGVVAYGVIANLCYSFGWIVEFVSRRKDRADARLRAEKQFVTGLWLSCLLTTAPLWFGLIFWLTHRNH